MLSALCCLLILVQQTAFLKYKITPDWWFQRWEMTEVTHVGTASERGPTSSCEMNGSGDVTACMGTTAEMLRWWVCELS